MVRIHPVLDQVAVPRWFVGFVLYHELLHAALGDAPETGSRKRHHGPEFRSREAAHPDYERAITWEKRYVNALIRSARTGKPLRARAEKPKLGAVIQRLLFD